MSLSPTVRPCAPSPVSEGRTLLGLAVSFLDSRIVAPLACMSSALACAMSWPDWITAS